MVKKTDQLFLNTDSSVGSFRFDTRVAEVFDDMIARSVPGYEQILNLLPTLTRIFVMPGKRYYDLGCSTGAGMLAMAAGLGNNKAELIGIDTSEPMLSEARTNLSSLRRQSRLQVEFSLSDVCDAEIDHAAMVLLNFTLQFIAVDKRDQLIRNIHSGLEPNGALVLSEKLASKDAATEAWLTRIHHQYKADQGYSELEISKKREAIENVLIPETIDTHIDRLKQAGFSTVTPWVRNLQFVSFLAIK